MLYLAQEFAFLCSNECYIYLYAYVYYVYHFKHIIVKIFEKQRWRIIIGIIWIVSQYTFYLLLSYTITILDLISGYQDEMTDALRFWRTRFLLIPMDSIPKTNSHLNPSNENLDDEELRIAGFNKFVELFEKSRWLQPTEQRLDEKKRHIRSGSSLNIQLTTLNTSSYVTEEHMKEIHSPNIIPSSLNEWNSNSVSSGKLTRLSSFHLITQAMQNLSTGCPMKDRRWHFQNYENVFIGAECVDWMIRSFDDIEIREEAVAFGNELLQKGIFEVNNFS